MSEQLFDLDRALDDFEHEELDKLVVGPGLADPSTKCHQNEVVHNSNQSGNGTLPTEVPSLMLFLNSPSSIAGTGTTTSLPRQDPTAHAFNLEILDEDTKDACGEFSDDKVAVGTHSSCVGTSHVVLEEQSSSNVDSGLCSSSEFTSSETGELPLHSSGPSQEFRQLDTLPSSLLMNQGPMGDEKGYTGDVALLFSMSSEGLSPSNTPIGACPQDNDSSLVTPTLTSPHKLGDSLSSVETPVAAAPMQNEYEYADLPVSAPPFCGIRSAGNSDTELSGSVSADFKKNDQFFFPETSVNSSKSFSSLPVAPATADSNEGSANTNNKSATRRPSSLLLSNSAADRVGRSRLSAPAVGTKRPSSLFGLPCVASQNADEHGSRQDKKIMLRASFPCPQISSSAMPVETVVEAGGIVPMETESAASMTTSSSTAPLSCQTAEIAIAPINPAIAAVRRSPSNCSANSEILQLPIPAVPSSASSCSPDSNSLSRSSLCDGMPSPSIIQPGTLGGLATDSNMSIDPVQPSNEDVGPISPSSMAVASQAQQVTADVSETETLDALVDLERMADADVEQRQQGRVLPCGDTLGREAPPWVPDSDAPFCGGCGVRFTFTKRRHHCRACGKVYCNSCCSLRYHLDFLNSVARVCIACYPELVRLEARRNNAADSGPPVAAPSALRSAAKTSSPSVGRTAETRRKQKKVVFSDGVRPGEYGEVGTSGGSAEEGSSPDVSPTDGTVQGVDIGAVASAGASASKPPKQTVVKPIPLIEAQFSWIEKSDFMLNGISAIGRGEAVVVKLNDRLALRIQVVDLSSCCGDSTTPAATTATKLTYYAVVSLGLSTSTESEYVLILRVGSLASYIDYVVQFYETLWTDAEQGRYHDELSCVMVEAVGFLVFRPSFQCTQHLPVPNFSRWMAAVFVSDACELAWARLFPLRLLLRLGHEFGHYPTSIISHLERRPLFHQPGHTVLSLFSDFRSFRYRLETVENALLHLDRATYANQSTDSVTEQQTLSVPSANRRHVLLLPASAANQIRQLALAGNEHVLAIGTSFSPSADGHLVAVQANPPDATYRTEAITMLGVSGGSAPAVASTGGNSSTTEQIRIVAGSFIIFNGSVRLDNGGRARFTILEDGAMLQITAEQMNEVRTALTSRQNYTVVCGPSLGSPESDVTSTDTLQIEWIENAPDLSTAWTRPQWALRCRLPIGFHSTMLSSLATGAGSSSTSCRVAGVYCWPVDSTAQASWCSPTVYTSTSLSNETTAASTGDVATAQLATAAYVLDRASLALCSATQLALSPFVDAIIGISGCNIVKNGETICETPVEVLVRIRLDPESLGFEAVLVSHGSTASFGIESASPITEYVPLPDAAVGSLDSELIPTLFNVAQTLGSKLPPGGLVFELALFTMPPVVVSQKTWAAAPLLLPTASMRPVTDEMTTNPPESSSCTVSVPTEMLIDSS